MPIITLTTDMGLKDYYVAAVKGAVMKQIPAALIIDISHEITPFNIIEAAFVIKNSYPEFPVGTIHIIGVNYESQKEKAINVVVEHQGQFFIGPDSGLFSLIFDNTPEKIVQLENRDVSGFHTFAVKNLYIETAAKIARGAKVEELGSTLENPERRLMFRPTFDTIAKKDVIKGVITYIDSYSNIFTNITQRDFTEFGKGRPFEIFFSNKTYNITTIHKSYGDVPAGERLALFGATGYLEIAINQGAAAKLLGMKVSETVRVEFE
jgi:S-adenosylmethionine hydrolase